MDPVSAIGAVASAATLLDALSDLAKLCKTLFDRIRNAAEHSSKLKAELSLFSIELKEIERISAVAPDELLEPHLNRTLLLCVEQVQKHLIKARERLAPYSRVQTLNIRLKWALRDCERADLVLKDLRQAREKLGGLMQLLLLRCSVIQHAEIRQLRSHVQPSMINVSQSPQYFTTTNSGKTKRRTNLSTTSWRSGEIWRFAGISSTMVSIEHDDTIDYSFAVRFDIPFGWLLGTRTIIANIAIQPLTSGWRLLPGAYISSARPLPGHHPFWEAITRGDVLQVRDMLRNGTGRTTDINEGNLTPLAVAIKTGRIEVVRELINHCADLHALIGRDQTSCLQWALWTRQLDIVRLLLAEGVSQDHINFRGWDSTFFCWPFLRCGDCMLEYLHMLANDTWLDVKIVDTKGWTILQRVAAYGQSKEIEALIKLGADPVQVALPLRWTAIHHSVFYGNYETFKVLEKRHKNDLLTITDERGWTLLHIAASANHPEIVRHLLQEGADPNALTRPFASHMPESLHHQRCTPQQVAAAQGQHVESTYLQILDELGLETFFDAEELQEDEKPLLIAEKV